MGRKLKQKTVLVLALMLAVMMAIGALNLSFFRGRNLNVSAILASGDIGVYLDEDCATRAYNINWGALSPGQTRKIDLYVRNEGSESFSLVITPSNWNPAAASTFMDFSWFCSENEIEANRVAKVTQILLVSASIEGIYDFGFYLVFETRPPRSSTPGDLGSGAPPKFFEYDGAVDSADLLLLVQCYMGTAPLEAVYLGDLGGSLDGTVTLFAYDGKIDWIDFALFWHSYIQSPD